jgi:hypothetical protein
MTAATAIGSHYSGGRGSSCASSCSRPAAMLAIVYPEVA